MPPMKYGVGQAVRRKEDQAFITGVGRYVDDETRDGVLRGYVLRSPYAHARFTIDGPQRGARPCRASSSILTAEDLADLGDLPCQALMKNADGKTQKQQRYPDPGDRHGAPCRRRRRLRRRRHANLRPRMRPRRSRSTTSRSRPSIDQRQGAGAGRAAGLAGATDPTSPTIRRSATGRRSPPAFAKAARVVTLDVINNRLVANYHGDARLPRPNGTASASRSPSAARACTACATRWRSRSSRCRRTPST